MICMMKGPYRRAWCTSVLNSTLTNCTVYILHMGIKVSQNEMYWTLVLYFDVSHFTIVMKFQMNDCCANKYLTEMHL